MGLKIKRLDAKINVHYIGTRNKSEILVDDTQFLGRDLSGPIKKTLKMSNIYKEKFQKFPNSN